MIFTTLNLSHFVSQTLDKSWQKLILISASSELTVLSFSTSIKKAIDVNERRVVRSTLDLNDVHPMEVLGMDSPRCENNDITDHILLFLPNTALTKVVVSPSVNSTKLSKRKCVMRATLNLNWVFAYEDFNNDWRILVGSINVTNTKLPMCVGSHRINQIRI